MNHTPEPWTLVEVGDKCKHFCPAKDDVSILTIAVEYDDEGDSTHFGAVYDREDARRIVACVNACAGIPTDELERIAKNRELINAINFMNLIDEVAKENGL